MRTYIVLVTSTLWLMVWHYSTDLQVEAERPRDAAVSVNVNNEGLNAVSFEFSSVCQLKDTRRVLERHWTVNVNGNFVGKIPPSGLCHCGRINVWEIRSESESACQEQTRVNEVTSANMCVCFWSPAWRWPRTSFPGNPRTSAPR